MLCGRNEKFVLKSWMKESEDRWRKKQKKKGKKEPALRPYYREAKNLVITLDAKLELIPREDNEEANRLAQEAYEKSLKS